MKAAASVHAEKQNLRARLTRGVLSTPVLETTGEVRQYRTPGERLDAKIREMAELSVSEQLERLDEASLEVAALVHLKDLRVQKKLARDAEGSDEEEEEEEEESEEDLYN